MSESKYQEYKTKARKLDELAELLARDNTNVFTVNLPDGARLIMDKTTSSFTVLSR